MMKTNTSILLMLLLACNMAWGQKQISGTVTDAAEDTPLPGVNVMIQGTSSGTVTNEDGEFTIEASSDDVLQFSFVGYQTETVEVGNQQQINIALAPSLQELEEVVVVGYGTQKKRDLTGSVSSVSSEDIQKVPTFNPLEGMQGRVAGVTVNRTSGQAGAGVDIRVRGNRSINGNNDPLLIIDGVQTGSTNISDLNPNNIESIEVLKDASATAIYGSQGANGVIIVTTKDGEAGETKISYNGSYGINAPTSYPEYNTGNDYLELRKEAFRTVGLWSPEDNNLDEDLGILFNNNSVRQAVDSGKWVDWHDELLRNGLQQSHNISISGGNDDITSLFSVGYFNEEGLMKNDNMDRFTARLNLTYNVNDWVETGMQTKATYYDINNRSSNTMSHASSLLPLGDAYDEDGDIVVNPIPGNPSLISPLTDERPNVAVDNTKRRNLFAKAFVELTPWEGVSLRSNVSINLDDSRNGVFQAPTSLDRNNQRTSQTEFTNSNSRFITWNNILTYSKEFDNHSIKLTGITDYTKNVSETYLGSGIEQELASSLFYNIQATNSSNRTLYSNYVGTETMSYAARINYTFKDRYLLTVTERVDGASRLAEGNQWDHFPSVAAGWRISDEGFMENVDPVSNLKLRVSYGVSGNSGIDPYGTQSSINPKPMGLGGDGVTGYLFDPTIGNDQLGWEKSKTTNIGLDVGLYDGRITANADAYRTNTTDILLSRGLPEMTGVEEVFQNIGSTQNEGIELSINSVNVQTPSFQWSTTVNYTKYTEKITGLISGDDIIDGINNSLVIGSPINSFYTYDKQGIFQTDDEEAMEYFAGDDEYDASPGHIKLNDLNGDSLIRADDDRKVIGSQVPDWFLGLDNTFTYNNWQLSVYVIARWGHMIEAEHLGRYSPSGEGNSPSVVDYWTPENPTNEFPRPRRGFQLSNYRGYQALRFVDGSFFKVNNVRLSYQLPNDITDNMFINSMSVNLTGNNLFAFTKNDLLKGYDPERGGSEEFPLTRQFMLGLNLDF